MEGTLANIHTKRDAVKYVKYVKYVFKNIKHELPSLADTSGCPPNLI